jgi:SAM-dependent methyltransferase
MDLPGWEERFKTEQTPKPPSQVVADVAKSLSPGTALDLACGAGRHALWLARQGWNVTAVDGSPSAIGALRELAQGLLVTALVADLEKHEYRIEPSAWDLIVISLYLQRDLFEPAKQGLKPGGVLIAITLLEEDEPRLHRLARGELAAFVAGWEVLHSFEGRRERHSVAEIAARRPK